ncbi:MAG: class I SAM-dependent methyltransferase [Pseudomonadota bacterium]
MIPEAVFFTVHRDLPREGPGEAADVFWALDVARAPSTARILDAACGPGADIVTLAEARPEAQILGVEKQAHFVEDARRHAARFGARVIIEQGSYMELDGQFDLIWCAGAVYFHGIASVLAAWRPHLAPGGAIAFSEPAWMIEPPSDAARAFWGSEYPTETRGDLEDKIHAAGFGIVGQRWVVDEPWAAYYGPMSARLDMLEDQAPDAALKTAIQEHRDEITKWQAAREEIAYSLFVVRPI